MALSASQPTEYISPIPQEERITILDILRGYALFGVLLINLRNFDLPGQLWTDSANQVALWLTIWLADTKFVTVFSFLFGVGFSLQIQRAESKGARSVPLYLRRLLVLACFGFLHYLIYDGDILFPYAVAGLGLLLLRGLSQRKILWIAAVCFLVPIVGYAFQTAGQEDIQIDRVLNLRLEGALRNETEFRRIYLEGSLLDVAAAHAKDFADWYTQWEPYLWSPRGGVGGIFMFPLPLFLLGYYVGRRGVFQNLRPHLSWIRKFSIWGLLLGLFLTAVSLASPILQEKGTGQGFSFSWGPRFSPIRTLLRWWCWHNGPGGEIV
jgi:uncharacterized protein